MHWILAFISFALILGTAVSCIFTYLGWLRRHEASAYTFIAFMFSVAIWSFSYALEQFTPELQEKIFWHKMAYVGISFVPLSWFVLNVQITGFRFVAKPLWLLALSIVPSLTCLLTWTAEYHKLMWGDFTIGGSRGVTYLVLERTPDFFVFVGYSYLLLIIGTALYLRLLWRSPTLNWQSFFFLSGAAALPILLNVLRIVFQIDPFHPYDLTPIALTTTGSTAGWFIFRFGLMDLLSLARNMLLESMRDGVLVIDLSGRVASANQSAQRMLHHNGDVLVGKELATALPELHFQLESLISFEQPRQKVASYNEVNQVTKEVHLFDSEEFEAQLIIDLSASYLYDRRQRLTGMLCVLRDITQRKRTQEALKQAQRVESIGLLAGGVAHDFNNLLASITLRHQLALMNLPEGSVASNHVEVADRTVERAADLTRQILAYTGKGNFKVEVLNINQLIWENEAIMGTAVPVGIELNFELTSHQLTVKADRGQLQQVIMNLLFNAVEAISSGRGRVQLRTDIVHLDTAEVARYIWKEKANPGKYVLLTVEDSGVGMSADVLTHIFDPFFTTKVSGRGLGLSALLGVIHACQGAVRVHSRVGHGTTFYTIFPAVNESIPEPSGLSPVSSETNFPDAVQHGSILIVDDEEAIMEAMSMIFEEMEFQIYKASNGQQAVEQFTQHRGKIDLIFLDVQMPIMNGLIALEKIRAIDSEIPILLTSGYSRTSVSATIDWNERTDFIQKPYTVEQLCAKVERMLGPAKVQNVDRMQVVA
ncbi:MAG: histidine kinase N-terminal 7TM domain-containing protein [Chloroflexota bacterium]